MRDVEIAQACQHEITRLDLSASFLSFSLFVAGDLERRIECERAALWKCRQWSIITCLCYCEWHIYARRSQWRAINTRSYRLQLEREPNSTWRAASARHVDATQTSIGTAGPASEDHPWTLSLRFNERLRQFLSRSSCWQITFKQKLTRETKYD